MKTIIGKLLKEQLGTGYNCEADSTSPSGNACIANQFGVGQFIDLPTCLASGCEDVQGACCDDCANFPNNFVPDTHYPSPQRFCSGCAIAAGTSALGLPPNQMYGLSTNIPYHTTNTTNNATGQDYCCDCCNQWYLPPPVTSIPNTVMDPCGNVVNGTEPTITDKPKCAHGECYYCPGSGKECKAVGPYLNQALDSQINLYTDKIDCETSEDACVVNPLVDTEKCHCCTPNKSYGPGPVVMPGKYAVGKCESIHSIGASLNPTGWISKEWFNCRPVSEPLACPGKKYPPKDLPKEPQNPTLGYKVKPKDVDREIEIREETNRFKQLVSEQLGTGYNCESDPTSASGFACVANQFGVGQFVDLPTCLASGCETIVEVPSCAQNGGAECFYCPGPGKEQTQVYQIGEKYTPTKKTVACVMVGSNNPNLLTNGTNLYNTKDECNAAESECMNPPNPLDSATKCHCCRKEQYIDVVYDQYPHVMIGYHRDCSFIERNGGQVNPNNILQTYQWEHCAPVSQPIPCSAKTPWVDDNNTLGYKTKPKEDMGRGVREETNRFKQLVSEQLGTGFNCVSDPTSSSGFMCINNQFGSGQFPTLAACQAAGCETTGICPAGHPFHGWPSGYPTDQPFTWNGTTISMNFGGVPLNFPTGSIIPGTYANWFNAGQSSYCEWCGDYNSGNAGGGNTNSQGFDLRTDFWSGGGYGPEACACCPGNNAMAGPLPKTSGEYTCSTGCKPGLEPNPKENEKTYYSESECKRACMGDESKSNCCDWCETSKGMGRPPKGCFDYDCDQCFSDSTDYSDFENTIREDVSNIRLLHKKNSKIKGNE